MHRSHDCAEERTQSILSPWNSRSRDIDSSSWICSTDNQHLAIRLRSEPIGPTWDIPRCKNNMVSTENGYITRWHIDITSLRTTLRRWPGTCTWIHKFPFWTWLILIMEYAAQLFLSTRPSSNRPVGGHGDKGAAGWSRSWCTHLHRTHVDIQRLPGCSQQWQPSTSGQPWIPLYSNGAQKSACKNGICAATKDKSELHV